MRYFILFLCACLFIACSNDENEQNLNAYDEVVIYDGLGEASNFYSYSFEGVDRTKTYHYFTKILSESAQLQLFLSEEKLRSNLELTRGDEVRLKAKGKAIGAATGLQVILLDKIQSITAE